MDELVSEEERQKLEAVLAFLDENTIFVPEPSCVTLYDFKVDWSKWSGSFRIKFDDVSHDDRFYFSEDGTGKVRFTLPMFVSPLGAPASYPAVEITKRTREAIHRALDTTFPKLIPHGKNRKTGIETTIWTPIRDRLTSDKLSSVKKLMSTGYSVSVRCGIEKATQKNESRN